MLKRILNRTRGRLSSYDSNHDPAAFNPLLISGLTAWLKADSLTGFAEAAGISLWPDSSGNSNSCGQGTAFNQPTVRGGVLNGKPVIRFNGTSHYLQFATNITVGPATIIVVANRTSGTNFRGMVILQKIGVYSSNATNQNWMTYTDTSLDSAVATDSTFRVMTSVVRAANDVDLITNGGSLVNRTAGTAYSARGASYVGADPGGSQYHGGDIAEILLFNSALGTADRQAVEAYLRAKYNTG